MVCYVHSLHGPNLKLYFVVNFICPVICYLVQLKKDAMDAKLELANYGVSSLAAGQAGQAQEAVCTTAHQYQEKIAAKVMVNQNSSVSSTNVGCPVAASATLSGSGTSVTSTGSNAPDAPVALAIVIPFATIFFQTFAN